MDVDFDWIGEALPRRIPAVIVSSPNRSGQDYKAAEIQRLTREWVNPTPRMVAGPGVMHTKVCLVGEQTGTAYGIPTTDLGLAF